MVTITVEPFWSYIKGLDTTTLSQLSDEMSFEVPGNEFSTYAHSNKKYLMRITGSDSGKFPTGLLERAQKFLSHRQVIHRVDSNLPVPQPHRHDAKRFMLRPYQSSAIIQTLGVADPTRTRKGGVLQAATGAGKTAMAAKMIALMNSRTLFVVHTKDLLMQAKRSFESFLGIECGVIGAGKKIVKPITIATIQSLCKGWDDLLAETELAIFDECHHVAAKTLYDTAMRLSGARCIVGLSASPWRDDNHDLMIEAVCGPVRHVITASDLIDQGFLVPPEIVVYRRQLPTNLKRLQIDAQSYQKAYRKVVVEDDSRNRLIQQIAKEQLAAGRRLLVLVRQVDHGQLLESMIPGSVFVEGQTKLADREKAFEDFRTGKIPCLIGTSLADEGVDIPNADALILAGAGSSSTRALQRIGRVIRCAPGKTSAFVADIVDEHKSFQRQFYARRKMYESERRFTIRTVNLPVD
jgi:superfamily II DNA or RNA helicase